MAQRCLVTRLRRSDLPARLPAEPPGSWDGWAAEAWGEWDGWAAPRPAKVSGWVWQEPHDLRNWAPPCWASGYVPSLRERFVAVLTATVPEGSWQFKWRITPLGGEPFWWLDPWRPRVENEGWNANSLTAFRARRRAPSSDWIPIVSRLDGVAWPNRVFLFVDAPGLGWGAPIWGRVAERDGYALAFARVRLPPGVWQFKWLHIPFEGGAHWVLPDEGAVAFNQGWNANAVIHVG